MRAAVAASLISLALVGCKKQRDGLPPAQEWSSHEDVGSAALPQVPGMVAPNANPHGGGGNPHAGMGMAMGGAASGQISPEEMARAHAGVDMSGAAPGGAGGGELPVLPPPDPNRKIDPNQRVRGAIALDPKLASRVKPGAVVFVFAKRADASGQPSGFPLVSEKLAWSAGGQLAFELTDEDAMAAGTALDGDVIVMARIDGDGDAGSKEAGDVVGQTRVKVPADGVKLTLDAVLP